MYKWLYLILGFIFIVLAQQIAAGMVCFVMSEVLRNQELLQDIKNSKEDSKGAN